MLIAPVISKLLRFFPPVVTGTIIAIIGISLMRVGVGWAMGGPAPLAQSVDVPKLVAMVDARQGQPPRRPARRSKLPGPIPMVDNPNYGALDNMAMAAFVLVVILLLVSYAKGFVANISVLLGIVAGCVVAVAMGKMSFDKVGQGALVRRRHAVRLRHADLRPRDDPDDDAGDDRRDDRVDRHVPRAVRHHRQARSTQHELAAGLRTDGLGTLIGGIFNTFPYTSFSQNVGLVGVTGVKSRWVCVAGGIIMIVLGLLPKMAALVESIPQFVLGGAGLVMFGMVAATGIRILVDGRLQEQPQQPLHRRAVDRLRPDPAGGAALDAADGARPAPAARVRHPADRGGGGGAEPVLQRREGRHGRRDRGREGGRSALSTWRRC